MTCMRRSAYLVALLGILLWTGTTMAIAASYDASYNDYGGIGLLQMPSARVATDGEVTIGAGYVDPEIHSFISFQGTPWLLATMRFSGDPDRKNDRDASLDLKIRLVKEDKYVPQVAVGFQDILGQGRYSGEYLVLSKRYYSFDFSAGIGWGYFGGQTFLKNPMRVFSPSFKIRNEPPDNGGGPQWKNYFSDRKVGFFAGIEYRTPVKGLVLKAEYSGESVAEIPAFAHLQASTPFNVGAAYQPAEFMEMAVGFERGDRVMFRLSLKANTRHLHGRGHGLFPDQSQGQVQAPTYGAHAGGYIPLHEGKTEEKLAYRLSASSPVKNERWQTALLKALMAAGYEGADFFVEGDNAELKVTFRDGRLARRAAEAAAIAYDYLPARYNNLLIKDRFRYGAGQNFSRSQVKAYAALDAQFDESWAKEESIRVLAVDEQGNQFGEKSIGREGRIIHWTERGRSKREDLLRNIQNVLQGRTVLKLSLLGERLNILVDHRGRDERDDLALAGAILQYYPGVTIAVAGEKEPAQNAEIIIETHGDDEVAAQSRGAYASVMGMAFPQQTRVVESDIAEISPAAGKQGKNNNVLGAAQHNKGNHEVPIIDSSVMGRTQTVIVSDIVSENAAWTILRSASLLSQTAPEEVSNFHVVVENQSIEVVRAAVLRRDLRRLAQGHLSAEEVRLGADIQRRVSQPGLFAPIAGTSWRERLYWDLRPDVMLHIGQSNDGGLRGHVFAKAIAEFRLLRPLKWRGEVSQSIAGNMDNLPETPILANSPKTRRDLGRYIQEGNTAIERFLIDYRYTLSPDWFMRLQAGLLERMYGGLQAEILHHAYKRQHAYGVDIAWVKKRDYDQLFNFQQRKTLSALVKYYYEDVQRGVHLQLSAGRFLAKDWGLRTDISRRIGNGLRIGAWATVTSMSASRYGPGRFDKGLYLTVPLEFFWHRPSSERVGIRAEAMGHDGGQMLESYDSLYETLYRGQYEAMRQAWQNVY